MGNVCEQGMKEDFIVVHLREPCSFCRKYISGGLRCALLLFHDSRLCTSAVTS